MFRLLLAASLLAGVVQLACAATFTVTNTAPVGPGSLAQAISDANANPGFDTIAFDIPGIGVQKIDLTGAPLPTVTDPVLIDGYTAPGSSPNTLVTGDNAVVLVELTNTQTTTQDPQYGLLISAGGSTVRGLSVTGSPSGGIALTNKGGNILVGNLIGIEPDGTKKGNATGIWITCPNNMIGDASPAGRNVISGNGAGILIGGQGGRSDPPILDATHNAILGNLIGTDATGTSPVPNQYGIQVTATPVQNSVIGGPATGAGNVISGNSSYAIRLGIEYAGPRVPPPLTPSNPTGITIQGNLIGTTADGQHQLTNGGGIVTCGQQTVIGGLGAGEGNVIVNSVTVADGSGTGQRNTILSNNIYPAAIGFLPVFFSAGDFPLANDYDDPDTGPNAFQNSPVISGVASANGTTTITGGLNSTPSTTFTLQFFAQNSSFPPGTTLLGTQQVTTNQFGNVRFTFTFPVATTSDVFITSTATDPIGNTSQTSPKNGVAQLANLSTRANVGTGENILDGGFIIQTHTTMKVLLRGLGPSTNVPDALADPTLTLFDNNGTIVSSNDNWKTDQQQAIQDTGIPPQYDSEAAIVATLNDGSYTAQLSGANGSTGIGLLEIYDVDPFTLNRGRLVNISTRGVVSGGDNVLIGGGVVRGDVVQNVIVRAIGPDLAKSGVRNPVQDPTLELRDDNGTLLASNDDWRTDQQDAIIATGVPPQDDRDSAIVTTLLPGQYTAIVHGKNQQTGLALIEFYNLNP